MIAEASFACREMVEAQIGAIEWMASAAETLQRRLKPGDPPELHQAIVDLDRLNCALCDAILTEGSWPSSQ